MTTDDLPTTHLQVKRSAKVRKKTHGARRGRTTGEHRESGKNFAALPVETHHPPVFQTRGLAFTTTRQDNLGTQVGQYTRLAPFVTVLTGSVSDRGI